MKKFILLFLIQFGITTINAQNTIQGLETNSSVGGLFENVFDQYGNKYSLADIKTNSTKQSITSRSSLTSTLLCTSGIFELYFETGSGMDIVSDITQNALNTARRTVACQVFSDLSNFINTPLNNPGNTTKVKIWVRDISQISGSYSNTLGLATSFFNMPNNTSTGFGGIGDNEIWKTIHAGRDSYTNIASPIITNGMASNISGLFYHGMMAFNFSNILNWNTNLGISTPSGQYDLYSVILHEVTHALGFASLINASGTSKFGLGYNYYSRYDSFLKNNSTTQPLITNSGSCSLYNFGFNTSNLNISVLQPALPCLTQHTTCTTAIKFVGTSTVPVYTPNCFETSSSLSHFEDECIGSPNGNNNNAYFTMTDANGMGVTKRFLKFEERNALSDIGYILNATYGNNSTVFGSFNNYTGAITPGINVAGINDGVNTNGSMIFIGNINTNILISSILNNDYNATSFECLQDVYSTATLSAQSGNSSTIITFNSTVSGIHLLRYVPVNGTKKGNITYIYVYVNPINNCALPNLCNLVSNGDFEQRSSIPDNAGQINKACGWFNTNAGSTPDYHYRNANAPWIGVPCNRWGYENDRFNLNGYAGMYIKQNLNSIESDSEIIATKLASPLLPNKRYQLSFDVSLSENTSANTVRFQAYLSNAALPIVTTSTYTIPIADPTMFFESPTFSTTYNGWQRIYFNFTTSSVPSAAGQQYLYIGGLNNVKYQTAAQAPTVQICWNSIIPNPYSYYFIDNVNLTDASQVSFTTPTAVCLTQVLSNLNTYVSVQIPNGTFAGNGVTLNNGIYSFNAATAGIGVKSISYSYTNNIGCLITLYSDITVSDCSSTSCPGNLVFDNPQITTLATYQAANTIITNTNYLVNAGSTITLKAGNSITFSPLSEVKAGTTSNFTAQIAACTQTSSRGIHNDTKEEVVLKSDEIDVAIYPNPFDKLFNIQIKGDELSHIIIATLDGKIIYEIQNIQSELYNIESEHFPRGLYLAIIETKSGILFNKKIIKN